MPTYYKSRYYAVPAVYVQEEAQWRSYDVGGTVRQSPGQIPDFILAQLEEIGENEALELIRQRLSGAPPAAPDDVLPAGAWGVPQPWQPSGGGGGAGPVGLGGWLVLPIIGLFLTVILNLVTFVRSMLPVLSPATWSALTTPGSAAYHPVWAPLLVFEAFVQVVLIVAPCVLLVLLFQRRRILPPLMLGLYGFNFIAALIDSFVIVGVLAPWFRAAGLGSNPDSAINSAGQTLGRAVTLAAIWIPYFLLSRRVKNTFVNPPDPARPPSLPPSRRVRMLVVGGAVGLLIISVAAFAATSVAVSGDASAETASPSGPSQSGGAGPEGIPASWADADAYTAYEEAFYAVNLARADLIDQLNALTDAQADSWKFSGCAGKAGELVNMVQKLPLAPTEVLAARDEYLRVLEDEQKALADLVKSGDGAWNRLNVIFPEEYKLWLAWGGLVYPQQR